MKTTIDIDDALLDRVRELAKRRGTSVKALVEDGLTRAVSYTHQTLPTTYYV